MKLKIFTDGGARGNPGPAAVGVVIKNQDDKIIEQFGKRIGISTNNVAEYLAIGEALEWVKILKNPPRRQAGQKNFGNLEGVDLFLDSQLVVAQLNGFFKVKNPRLRELIFKIRQLEQEIGGNVSYRVIPREENKLADSLVNQALDKLE